MPLDRKDAERDAKGRRLLSKIPAALFGCGQPFYDLCGGLRSGGRQSGRRPWHRATRLEVSFHRLLRGLRGWS